jgi:hypothetical protein
MMLSVERCCDTMIRDSRPKLNSPVHSSSSVTKERELTE